MNLSRLLLLLSAEGKFPFVSAVFLKRLVHVEGVCGLQAAHLFFGIHSTFSNPAVCFPFWGALLRSAGSSFFWLVSLPAALIPAAKTQSQLGNMV